MDIETITSFRTTDGEMHDNLQNAEAHQIHLDLRAAFRTYQAGRPGGMGWAGFQLFLNLNRELVRSYLDKLEKGDA